MSRLGAILVAAAVAWACPAAAWDSICYQYEDATADVPYLRRTTRNCSGIEAARGRWRDPVHFLDEHRYIFELAASRANLPSSLLETMRLLVLTDSASHVVAGDTGNLPTVAPLAPRAARRAVVRAFSLDEFAQLPDFSYALWDWARGNESCPLDLPAPLNLPAPFNAPQVCHAFSTHMGAVNSNHFPPQSDQWFDYYHQLALGRAAACRTTRAAVWDAEPGPRKLATDARFATYWRACEVEALAYEAVAQHFLQDSWSAGHLWHRWGSTRLTDFPAVRATGSKEEDNDWNSREQQVRSLLTAEMTALTAGTIHGSDPVVFEKSSFFLTLHDPIGFPDTRVLAIGPGNSAGLQAVGDLHLHDAVGGPPLHSQISSTSLPYPSSALSGQAEKILGCAAGSLGTVYAALEDTTRFGHAALGARNGSSPAFDRAACRAFAVTNRGFDAGVDAIDIQFKVSASRAALINIPKSVNDRVRDDYGRIRYAASILAKARPTDTDMASLQLTSEVTYKEQSCTSRVGCTVRTFTVRPGVFTMLGVEPNRCYAAGGGTGCTATPPGGSMPADFADPALTGPLAAPNPSTPSGTLALAFHASRTPQLCNALTAGDLDALNSVVASASTGAERAAACDACAEYMAPFLRVGTDAAHYDTTAEPLCHFSASDPSTVPYVYEPALGTSNPVALARRHCGCKGLIAATNNGLQRLSVNATSKPVRISTVGALVPVGSIPRDVAAASNGRLLVTNGAGQIVGVRDDFEVDLDGDASNGITRLSFSGISDLQGVAVANVAGKELALAAASGTGELVAYDLGAHRLCDRITVRQTVGEGAYDIVVPANGTKIFVSLRMTSPVSGKIAVVDASALALCNGSAAATLRYITPPGAAVGLGPMALSPDGSLLAVGGRYASTCLDQIRSASGSQQDVQVGCDRVFIMDMATETFRSYGTSTGLPTRPGRYPYAIAWFSDGIRIAYAAFQGIDAGGSTNSGWPAGSPSPLPFGGTLRLADTSSATYQGGGGGVSRNWTYNMPLLGNVIGEAVVIDGNWVFVGTASGRISAYEVTAHDSSLDAIWEASDGDPETTLHVSTNGTWYGGCRYACSLPGGVCAEVCPNSAPPTGFSSIELGASVRVLAGY